MGSDGIGCSHAAPVLVEDPPSNLTSLRWRIVREASPALRRWGDEYVVHHALSNDTYRLSLTAGHILMAFDPTRASDGLTFPTDDADGETALEVLVELGFITRC
jgi:hypothetical protein